MKPEYEQKIDNLEADGKPIVAQRGGMAPEMFRDVIAFARTSRNLSELEYSIREIHSFIEQCKDGIAARKG